MAFGCLLLSGGLTFGLVWQSARGTVTPWVVPRQAPPLGPALPGDLGRPILHAQSASAAGMLATDSEKQRLGQEIEAARLSRLFASTSIREQIPAIAQGTSVGALTIVPNQTSQPAQPAPDDAFAQNGQDRKLAFVNASVNRRTTSPDRTAAPASSYVVQAGHIIPASLVTGIRSDLPGQITAQIVTLKAFSPSQRPSSSRLFGRLWLVGSRRSVTTTLPNRPIRGHVRDERSTEIASAVATVFGQIHDHRTKSIEVGPVVHLPSVALHVEETSPRQDCQVGRHRILRHLASPSDVAGADRTRVGGALVVETALSSYLSPDNS